MDYRLRTACFSSLMWHCAPTRFYTWRHSPNDCVTKCHLSLPRVYLTDFAEIWFLELLIIHSLEIVWQNCHAFVTQIYRLSFSSIVRANPFLYMEVISLKIMWQSLSNVASRVYVTDFVEIWVLELPRDCALFVTHLSRKSIGYSLSSIVYRLSSIVYRLPSIVYRLCFSTCLFGSTCLFYGHANKAHCCWLETGPKLDSLSLQIFRRVYVREILAQFWSNKHFSQTAMFCLNS